MSKNRKKILLIMPRFYSYIEVITQELYAQGYDVMVCFEEPPRILFLVIRKLQKIFKTNKFYGFYNKYLLKKIKKSNNVFDVLLVIRGNIVSLELIHWLKNNCMKKNAHSVYYTWDSLEFLEHKGRLGQAFDEKYSFDSVDVRNNSGWKFLPLFYSDEYTIESDDVEKKYDLACICSLNKYRYKMIKEIIKCNPSLKIFCRFQISKPLFEIKRMIDPFFKEIDRKDVIYKPFDTKEIVSIYSCSRAVLDVTYSNQNGLSMRTIEAIGMGKKIATNNKNILCYDFNSLNNVYLYDEDNMEINFEWLETQFCLDKDIQRKYSIKSWLSTMINNNSLCYER